MWLQRVLFNFQTRLLGREEHKSFKRDTPNLKHRLSVENDRVQLVQDRLLDLDRRVAELR